MTLEKARSRFFRYSYPNQYLMACMRVSQFSFALSTLTRPPTAATLGRVKRATRCRTASRSTITSESTETMISLVAWRTALLMPRRLPML